jgi:hypothetical protein
MNHGPCHPPFHPRNRGLLIAGHLLAGLAHAAVLALVFGWIFELLWNHVMPGLLGTRSITYGQSVGLILMARILVGGLRPGRGHGRRLRPRWCRPVRGRAWTDYDQWWREVGEKSFQEYAGGAPDRDRDQRPD